MKNAAKLGPSLGCTLALDLVFGKCFRAIRGPTSEELRRDRSCCTHPFTTLSGLFVAKPCLSGDMSLHHLLIVQRWCSVPPSHAQGPVDRLSMSPRLITTVLQRGHPVFSRNFRHVRPIARWIIYYFPSIYTPLRGCPYNYRDFSVLLSHVVTRQSPKTFFDNMRQPAHPIPNAVETLSPERARNLAEATMVCASFCVTLTSWLTQYDRLDRPLLSQPSTLTARLDCDRIQRDTAGHFIVCRVLPERRRSFRRNQAVPTVLGSEW